MSKTIEAVYENGVFRPLEPVYLPEGGRVHISMPEVSEEIQRRLLALDAFEASFENLSAEQWRLFDEAIERRRWFGDHKLDL